VVSVGVDWPCEREESGFEKVGGDAVVKLVFAVKSY